MKKILLLGAMVCALFASCGKNNLKPWEVWHTFRQDYRVQLNVNPNNHTMHAVVFENGYNLLFQNAADYTYSFLGDSVISIKNIGDFTVTHEQDTSEFSNALQQVTVLSYLGELPDDLTSIRTYRFFVTILYEE